MKSYGSTNVGLVRKVNEDAFYCQQQFENGKPYICVVADGMGGHNAGEVASSMAISQVIDFIGKNADKLEDINLDGYKNLIKDAFLYANKNIYKKSMESKEYIGMGTTLTTVLIIDDSMIVGHVGDSRVYFIRNHSIRKITDDHSYVAELIKNGTIKPEEANNHPQKNLITRAVGTGKNIEVDIDVFNVNDGDFIVMCTDGLSNLVEKDKIFDVVISDTSLKEKCSHLISLANSKGGYDNITVVVIEINEGGASLDR